jgi:hypothetical protein
MPRSAQYFLAAFTKMRWLLSMAALSILAHGALLAVI